MNCLICPHAIATPPHGLAACEQPFRKSTTTTYHLVARRNTHTHAKHPATAADHAKQHQHHRCKHDVHESHFTCMQYASAIPASPNDPAAYRSRADLIPLQISCISFRLILGAAEFIILFEFFGLLRFVLHRWQRAVWVRSNAVMSLSHWLDGDETNGKQGKQRGGRNSTSKWRK